MFSLECTYEETSLVDTYFALLNHFTRAFFNASKGLLKASIAQGNGSSGQGLKAVPPPLRGVELELRNPRVTLPGHPPQLAPSLLSGGVELETTKSYLMGGNYMEPQRIQPHFFNHLYRFRLEWFEGVFVLQIHVLIH